MSKSESRVADQGPGWLEALCQIALKWATGGLSIRDQLQRASPDIRDPSFTSLVRTRLAHDPDLIAAWQLYSYDKRTSASPWLDGTAVGFFEFVEHRAINSDIRHHANPVDACADFIGREASWVLEGRRLLPGEEKAE